MSSNNNKILIDTLPKYLRPAAKFVRHQEQASGLSTSRFVQDVATCLIPKAVFSRSAADLAENTFLETSEETLVYFVPAILGQYVARNIFSKGLPDRLKKEVATTGVELLDKAKNDVLTKENNKKTLPIKAAIALTAMFIPLTEYSLNYIKNLMTLKLFKKSDFKNIASLEKNDENEEHQKMVEASAKKHIKLAAGLYAGCLTLAGLLATRGKNSKQLQKISEFIVAPGNKLFSKNEKAKNFVNKYFNMDFNNQNGRLVLSKGQLTTTVLVGGAGYFGASADRGKENLKETATRFPLVALYVITGSELVEKGFRALLHKMGKCKDLIDKDLKVPKFDELAGIAEKLSKERKTTLESEYKSLAKQKVLISGLPYLFAIGVMGFFVAGMTNYFTKRRYQKAQVQKS
ncbi:MAG: hypothetical protein II183_00960 [Elusimicrobiaceae bacterium]|nr:hypothetical protein [Elusimicrobiaceae bacterium]